MRMRVLADDRRWIFSRNLFNLHAASGGRHQQNAAATAIDECREVDLTQDLGRGGHEDAAHGEILDRQGEDLCGDLLRLFGGGGELDATRLAASTNEHLRLDDNLLGATGEESLRSCTGGGRGGCNLTVRDGEAGAAQEFPCLSLMQFHLASARWIGHLPESSWGSVRVQTSIVAGRIVLSETR